MAYTSTTIFLDIDGVISPIADKTVRSIADFSSNDITSDTPRTIGTFHLQHNKIFLFDLDKDITDSNALSQYILDNYLTPENHGKFGTIIVDKEQDIFVIFDHVKELLKHLTTSDKSVVWSSSWGDFSNEINDALGLPHFDVLLTGGKTSKPATLKKFLRHNPEIKTAYLVEDSPYAERIHRYVDSELLVIKTEGDEGLSTAQVERLESVVFSHQFA